MFLRSKRSYTRDGQQRASGPFLLVFCCEKREDGLMELRACIRHANMRQLGHFMMATVRIGKHKVTLSGTYGDDGLPIDCNEEKFPGLWNCLVPLPPELVEAFWRGGGHNEAGSEAYAMHEWAKMNELKLKIRKV